jgi:hypothetical protein
MRQGIVPTMIIIVVNAQKTRRISRLTSTNPHISHSVSRFAFNPFLGRAERSAITTDTSKMESDTALAKAGRPKEIFVGYNEDAGTSTSDNIQLKNVDRLHGESMSEADAGSYSA